MSRHHRILEAPVQAARSREGVYAIGMFLQIIVFDALWCMITTFRGFSSIDLYVNAALGALLLTLPYMITRRGWVMLLTMLVADAVMISNLMYCRTYMSHIPLSSYMLGGNLADFTASVADSMRVTDMVLPIIAIATWRCSNRHVAVRTDRKSAWLRYGTLTLTLIGVNIVMTGMHGGFTARYEHMHSNAHMGTQTTTMFTLAGDLIYDYMHSGITATPEQLAKAHEWLADNERLRPWHKLAAAEENPRRSMVVILLESFESWPIGLSVEGKEITPVLNRELEDTAHTLYAPKVYTQVAQGRSIDGQLLLNAGLLPMESEVFAERYPLHHYPTLTKAIKERHGGKAYFMSVDKPYVWNMAMVAEAFGADTLLTNKDWGDAECVGAGNRTPGDHELFRRAAEKMRHGEIWPTGEAAYVQMASYSGHNPFRLPEHLKTIRFEDKEMPERMNDFLTMAHFTDASLKPMLEYLRSRPDYKDMIIVITGDHEGLAADRKSIRESRPGARLVPDEGFTPLIVLNSPVGMRFDKVMGQIDMYPTLLALMGLDDYEWKGLGQSITDPSYTSYAISSMTNAVAKDSDKPTDEMREHLHAARSVSNTLILADSIPGGRR